MSNFRDKAAAIKAEGEAKRGEFNPQGAPLRAYNYWLWNSSGKKAVAVRQGSQKENFCHFWRVVAIWAPLFWLGERAADVIDSRFFKPVASVLFVAAVVGAVLLGGGLPGLWLMLSILAAVAAAFAVLVALGFWIEKYPEFSKKVGQKLAWAAIVGGVLFLLGLFIGSTGWFGVLAIALAGVLGVVVYKNIENLADWIEGFRERSRQKERERKAKRRQYVSDFYDEHGYYPHEAPTREPGRVAKFFRGVGDFIIMWAQVIRVNKWKICPIVELKETV